MATQPSKKREQDGRFAQTGLNQPAGAPKEQTRWEVEAERIIKAEMARRDITYKGLAQLLKRIGEPYTERNLISRINRGTFPFSFALKCLHAMSVESIRIEPVEAQRWLREAKTAKGT